MTFERKRKGDSSELAKLKKEIGTKKIKFTFLLDDEHRSKIKSIAAMKKTTVTDILCSYILEYIQKNGG